MTTPIPDDGLEQRAASQRLRLHDSVSELRHNVRERFDVEKTARAYLWPASAVAGLVALVLGYRAGGAFTD
jgi:hypothetical protein